MSWRGQAPPIGERSRAPLNLGAAKFITGGSMAAHQILVIEARGWIAELLYRAGFDSTSVKSFGDLLHRFYSEPSPEVIVGDALLLTEEAFYVCENMKTMQPNLPIFIIDDENMRIESESDAYFYSVRETDFFIEKIKEILYVNDELIDLSGMESEAVLPIPPEPISEFDALDFDDFQYSSKSNTQRLPDVSIQKKNENFHQEIISPNDANHDFTQIPTERRINSELNSNIIALEDDNLDVLESLDLFNHTNVLSGHDENHAIGLIDDSNEDLFLSEEVLFSTEIQPENIGFKSNNSLGLYQKHLIEEDDSLSLDQLSYEFTAMYSSVSYEPQGYYGNLSFPEILYQCFSGHFTGRLLLKRNAIIREIYFSHGSPLDAETNLLKDSIAYILLQDKKIDEYTYQKIVAERRLDPNSRFLDLIKKEGILSDLELDEAKKQQTKNILLSCFSWSNASYGMNYDPEIQKRAQSAQPLNLLPIIFEGIKTAQPVELLARHFDNYMRCPVEPSPRLNDYAMMLRAFSDDLKLASLFDGTRPLGEILARAPLGLIDALRIIRALEITSCITFGEALTPDVLESVQRRGRAASSSGRPPQGRPAQAGSVGRPQRPMATRPKLERRSQPASVRPAPAAH
ncbi:hypothetical protein KJ940_19875, partial [Myxococcota bacterium]|nr:hypothetical protein [Myxococcota bacterium]